MSAKTVQKQPAQKPLQGNTGAVDVFFLELVRDGLTKEELLEKIENRPHMWGKYVRWLDKLPNDTHRR